MTQPTWTTEAAPAEAATSTLPERQFPSFIDSTMLASATACETRAYWSWIRNLHPKGQSVHLVAGGAYAKGLEIFRRLYYTGTPFEEAQEEGFLALTREYGDFDPASPSEYKTWDRTAAAYLSYLKEYPPEEDFLRPHFANGKPCVEFSFAIPLPGTAHPVTGDPILYAGRCDMIGEARGQLYVLDDKTTKSFSSNWADQWKLRGQFTGYCWAARVHGYPVVGAMIRGTAIQKTQIKHLPAITTRDDHKIERWLQHAVRVTNRMTVRYKQYLENQDKRAFDMSLDDACNSYGGCAYSILCESRDPEPFVDTYYSHRQWNPLARENSEEPVVIEMK